MPPDRRRGRPPLDPDDPSVGICLKVTPRQYDAVYTRAQAARTTIPELIRRELGAVTGDPPRRPDGPR